MNVDQSKQLIGLAVAADGMTSGGKVFLPAVKNAQAAVAAAASGAPVSPRPLLATAPVAIDIYA